MCGLMSVNKNMIQIKKRKFRKIIASEMNHVQNTIGLKFHITPHFIWRNDLPIGVAGHCAMGGHFIAVDRRYIRKKPGLFRGIIRHELLHIFRSEHDEEFRRMASMVDAPEEVVSARQKSRSN